MRGHGLRRMHREWRFGHSLPTRASQIVIVQRGLPEWDDLHFGDAVEVERALVAKLAQPDPLTPPANTLGRYCSREHARSLRI